MPTPQREPLRRLSRAERAALQRIVHSRSERVDRVRRATALLAVARTGVFIQAAREAGLHSGTTVADLVARFNRVGLAVVSIAPGRGRKATYLLSALAQIVATAQREPDRRTDGTATWSLSTLQRALRRAGLKRVGTSTIRRVLQEAGSAYQRTRTWCPTGTAQRKRKSGVVTVVDPKTEEKRTLIDQAYRLAEAMGIPLWCQDEAGPYQAIPQPGQSWQPEGKPRRQPHEYLRGGTAKLLTLFRPATGEVRAKGVPRAPNVVLHPWLQHELLEVLEELPEVSIDDGDLPSAAQWATWLTRRGIIRMLISRVEIDHTQVNIVFRVPPDPFVASPDAPDRGVLQHYRRRALSITGQYCPRGARRALHRMLAGARSRVATKSHSKARRRHGPSRPLRGRLCATNAEGGLDVEDRPNGCWLYQRWG